MTRPAGSCREDPGCVCMMRMMPFEKRGGGGGGQVEGMMCVCTCPKTWSCTVETMAIGVVIAVLIAKQQH